MSVLPTIAPRVPPNDRYWYELLSPSTAHRSADAELVLWLRALFFLAFSQKGIDGAVASCGGGDQEQTRKRPLLVGERVKEVDGDDDDAKVQAQPALDGLHVRLDSHGMPLNKDLCMG